MTLKLFCNTLLIFSIPPANSCIKLYETENVTSIFIIMFQFCNNFYDGHFIMMIQQKNKILEMLIDFVLNTIKIGGERLTKIPESCYFD